MGKMLIGEKLYCRHCKRFLQVNTEIKKCAFCGRELLVSRDYYLSNDFVDTMRIAKHVLPNIRNYKLATLADYFDVDYRNAHRGLKDVEITYEVYNKMKELAKN